MTEQEIYMIYDHLKGSHSAINTDYFIKSLLKAQIIQRSQIPFLQSVIRDLFKIEFQQSISKSRSTMQTSAS